MAKDGEFQINKKGVIADYLPWLLIAIAILVIITISVFLLKDKGFNIIDKLKNLFNFGGQ